jgi:Zn-dependent protease with chaperone function
VRTIGLLFALLLLAFGLFELMTFSLPYLAFNWEDSLIYLAIAAIVYGLLWLVGHSLNGRFDQQVRAFTEGKADSFSPNGGLLRTFGFLLLTLLPYLVYLFLFALYAAAAFGLVGLAGLAQVRRVPIVLVIGLSIIVLGTGFGVLSGFYYLIRPPRRRTTGISLSQAEHPDLWNFARETAELANAEPVAEIIVTPEPGIGVYLEGSVLGAIAGGGRRTLEIGSPSLHGLSIGELGAILAHEYGHFSHRDTQWAPFNYAMGSALLGALRATPGPATIDGNGLLKLVVSLNPAHWILRAYTYLFFRTTGGFSRVREVLADVLAATLYGGQRFADALTKVATNDALFAAAVMGQIVPGLLREGRVISDYSKCLADVYVGGNEEAISRLRESVLSSQAASAYDSHPPVRSRLDYTARFDGTQPDDSRPASELFENWDSLNSRLADMLNERLVAMGAGRVAPAPAVPTESARQ